MRMLPCHPAVRSAIGRGSSTENHPWTVPRNEAVAGGSTVPLRNSFLSLACPVAQRPGAERGSRLSGIRRTGAPPLPQWGG